MNGILLYVMGPSGSGKDSLLAYARRALSAAYAQTWKIGADSDLRPVLFVRRYITRPAERINVTASSSGQMNLEDVSVRENHHPLTREEFAQRKAAGEFALDWESHGLCYGISREIDASLAAGALVIVNGSREYLPEALKRYPELVPLLVTVRPEILRARLEKRGRESAADIEERLAKAAMLLPRAALPLAGVPSLVTLDNSGELEEAGQRFAELCNQLRRI